MSFLKWSRYASILALNVVVLATVAQLCVSVWTEFNSAHKEYEEYKHHTAERQNRAADEIGKRCSVTALDTRALRDCIANEVRDYEARDHSDRDLQAQQDVAFWAFWAVVVSGGGLAVSLIGLLALLQSLRQTKQAITNDREIGNAQVRAYVDVIPMRPEGLKEGSVLTVHFRVDNTGQSPARRVHYVAAAFIAEFPISPTRTPIVVAVGDLRNGGSTIKAGGEIFGEAFTDSVLTKEEIELITGNSTHRLYLYGFVTYIDVFNAERKTKFCYFFQKGSGPIKVRGREGMTFNWIVASSHNEAT